MATKSEYFAEEIASVDYWIEKYCEATNSTQSRHTRQSKIMGFLNFVANLRGESNAIAPMDVTIEEGLAYLQWIERDSGYTYETKCQRYKMLMSFYKYIQDFMELKGQVYLKPIPARSMFPPFTERADNIKREEFTEGETRGSIPISQIVKILSESRFYGDMWLAIYVLAIVTGAAPGEVLSIKRDDFNLMERFFFTGMEDGAKKHNRIGKKPLAFCFPEWAIPILARWLKIRDNNPAYRESKYLFPAKTAKGWVYAQRFAEISRAIAEKLGIEFVNKDFRSSIITHRDLIGCPKGDNYYLQNHSRSNLLKTEDDEKMPRETNTQEQYYKKSWIIKRRNLYDTYNPYALQDFADI
jgi:integrase